MESRHTVAPQPGVELTLAAQRVLDDARHQPPEHVAIRGEEAWRVVEDVDHRFVQEVLGVAVLPQGLAEPLANPAADPRHVALHQFMQRCAVTCMPAPQQRFGRVTGRG